MNGKQLYCLLILLISCIGILTAQDTTRRDTVQRLRIIRPDSIRPDTPRRRFFDSSLFADANTLTNSDYLVKIQNIYQVLNKVPVVTGSFSKLDEIADNLEESDSALSIIKERLSLNDRTLNLRNLQMFRTLLEAIQESDKKYTDQLNKYDATLGGLKKEILELRKDTSIRTVYRDSVLRKTFITQLQGLRIKWKNTDSLVRLATTSINDLEAHSSANTIAVTEMLNQTDVYLSRIGPRAFTKERNYLWEPFVSKKRNISVGESFRKSVTGENKAVHYYFANTRNKRLWLLLTGLVFFYWVFYNFRSLKRRDKLNAVDTFNFRYINPVPVAASLVFMLNLAPLFDLHAPAIYIETTQFLLLIILTVLFWTRWPRQMFYYWCMIVVLFLLLSFSRIAGLPYYLQRWWVLFISIAAMIAGLLFLSRLRKSKESRIIVFASWLYILFNWLAILCNVFGRLTLTQIFGYTSIYAFAQIISLSVFVQLMEEAFLLQIQSSRIRKNYPLHFDASAITTGINKLVSVLALVVWLIAFTTNLNIYNFVYDQLQDLLTTQREIGSFSFTLGGAVLFLGIIWFANFLQRYIAYFFGDVGDDASFDNKGQRSRLMITRLILLIAGFLLAVAASGLPVDRITVILGALGVGVGLGLQNIVNNFVSGIILIFDRPLRIGDSVEVGDKKGRVKEISIRSSTLLTGDGAEVIIPNGDVLSHNIVNWTLSNNHMRIELPVIVDKFPDQEQLKEAFKKILESSSNVLMQKEPEVEIASITGKSVTVLFSFWCKDVSMADATRSEINTGVYKMLQEKGVNII